MPVPGVGEKEIPSLDRIQATEAAVLAAGPDDGDGMGRRTVVVAFGKARTSQRNSAQRVGESKGEGFGGVPDAEGGSVPIVIDFFSVVIRHSTCNE